MHPNLDELLALRDGNGSAGIMRHVEGCEGCSAEIEGLCSVREALRALPPCPPPDGSWEFIRKRLTAERRRPVDAQLGVAAAVLLALLTAAIMGRLGLADRTVGDTPGRDTRETVEQLTRASRDLELVLRDGSMQSPIMKPRRAALIVELEDRIALIDLAIAQNQVREPDVRTVALWSDRVQLLDALVTARGGEVGLDGIIRAGNRNQGSQQ